MKSAVTKLPVWPLVLFGFVFADRLVFFLHSSLIRETLDHVYRGTVPNIVIEDLAILFLFVAAALVLRGRWRHFGVAAILVLGLAVWLDNTVFRSLYARLTVPTLFGYSKELSSIWSFRSLGRGVHLMGMLLCIWVTRRWRLNVPLRRSLIVPIAVLLASAPWILSAVRQMDPVLDLVASNWIRTNQNVIWQREVAPEYLARIRSAYPGVADGFDRLRLGVPPAKENGARSPDVVLLISESLSQVDSRRSGGLHDRLPRIDELQSEGFTLTNVVSDGSNTADALAALLLGVDPLPTSFFIREMTVRFPAKSLGERNVVRYARQRGYATAALTNSISGFLQTGQWLKSLGFGMVAGGESDLFRNERRYTFNSPPDHALYGRALEWMGRAPAPFFLTLLTISLHRPYQLPEDYPAVSWSLAGTHSLAEPRPGPCETLRFQASYHTTAFARSVAAEGRSGYAYDPHPMRRKIDGLFLRLCGLEDEAFWRALPAELEKLWSSQEKLDPALAAPSWYQANLDRLLAAAAFELLDPTLVSKLIRPLLGSFAGGPRTEVVECWSRLDGQPLALAQLDLIKNSLDWLNQGNLPVKKESAGSTSQILAHRGGLSPHPENSLAAFQHAASLGVDGFECDLRLSRDQEVFVLHDLNLLRLTGKSLDTKRSSASELHALRLLDPLQLDRPSSEPPLPLRRLLEAFGGKQLLWLELKPDEDQRLAHAVASHLERLQALDKVIVSSFSARMLEPLRQAFPALRVAYEFHELAETTLDKLLRAKDRERLILSVHQFPFFYRELLKRATAAGLRTSAFTPNRFDALRAALEQGVTYIQTDRPERALFLVGAANRLGISTTY